MNVGLRKWLERAGALPAGGFGLEFGAVLEGRETLLLSGVTALHAYSEEEITLRSRSGRVRVIGTGMTMLGFGGGRITVRGRIDGLILEGEE